MAVFLFAVLIVVLISLQILFVVEIKEGSETNRYTEDRCGQETSDDHVDNHIHEISRTPLFVFQIINN